MPNGESDSNLKKTFVLDTNVLIHDPEAVLSFEENDVVIPLKVIKELDSIKKGIGEIPYSAREALRTIDALRKGGNIIIGITLYGGGRLKIIEESEKNKELKSADDIIISVAVDLSKKIKNVVMVSKDTAVRIIAEALGVTAQDYTKDKTTIFKKYGKLLIGDDYTNGILSNRYQLSGDDIYRIWGEDTRKPIIRNRPVWEISPKNYEQECVIDALRSPEIEVVALTGIAGSGKTLLTLAVGLNQTTKGAPLYDRVLVARPTIPMGGKEHELGFLPGSKEDKLNPWMQPIYDNLEVIVKTHGDARKGKQEEERMSDMRNYQYLIDRGTIQIESLQHIRGRSLPRTYFIIDEAQNLRPLDVKTIVTRCGEGTKLILTGDLEQIDTPYLDAESNGLAYLIARYINEEEFCYLHLETSARSRMAEKGARLL